MRARLFFWFLAALLIVVVFYVRNVFQSRGETVFEPANKPPPLAPMCPWRNPERDLAKLFPNASRFQLETRILSGLRSEMTARLGRAPAPDENSLPVYRIYGGDQVLGEVVARRLKGTFGAIEIVVAVDRESLLKGVLLQRFREPQASSDALLACDWAGWLGGKGADSSWDCEALVAGLPSAAQDSARAIIEGARTAAVLLSVSETAPHPEFAHSHH